MTINVEKKDVLKCGKRRDLTSTYEALREMKVGESFLQEAKEVINIRTVLSACKVLIGSHFVVRKEGKQYRVGRIK